MFGGGSPSVDYEPTEVVADEKKLKKLRTALFKTPGGAAGEEVLSGDVSKRDTIFGN